MGAGDETWPSGEGWKDSNAGGYLPLLSANQGAIRVAYHFGFAKFCWLSAHQNDVFIDVNHIYLA